MQPINHSDFLNLKLFWSVCFIWWLFGGSLVLPGSLFSGWYLWSSLLVLQNLSGLSKKVKVCIELIQLKFWKYKQRIHIYNIHILPNLLHDIMDISQIVTTQCEFWALLYHHHHHQCRRHRRHLVIVFLILLFLKL